MCVVKQAWCFYTGFFVCGNTIVRCALCKLHKLLAKSANKRKERKETIITPINDNLTPPSLPCTETPRPSPCGEGMQSPQWAELLDGVR
jgi:hypothetical protein